MMAQALTHISVSIAEELSQHKRYCDLCAQLLLDQFTSAWRKSGHTPSADENDHNYDTFLGQGNTLGFVTGTLEIDPSALDEEVDTTYVLG